MIEDSLIQDHWMEIENLIATANASLNASAIAIAIENEIVIKTEMTVKTTVMFVDEAIVAYENHQKQ